MKKTDKLIVNFIGEALSENNITNRKNFDGLLTNYIYLFNSSNFPP